MSTLLTGTLLLVLVIVAVVVAAVVLLIKTYNRLVALKNRVDNQGAQVDVQLKRRADLIPNLIEITKGYANHEQSTLTSVTELRGKMLHAGSVQESYQANEKLTRALSPILALGESYPELKANTNFLKLQSELADTEDKISKARQFYNDVITKYNTAIQMFPTSLFAGLFGFQRVNLLEASAADRQGIQMNANTFRM